MGSILAWANISLRIGKSLLGMLDGKPYEYQGFFCEPIIELIELKLRLVGVSLFAIQLSITAFDLLVFYLLCKSYNQALKAASFEPLNVQPIFHWFYFWSGVNLLKYGLYAIAFLIT
jgi:hypothetical protein